MRLLKNYDGEVGDISSRNFVCTCERDTSFTDVCVFLCFRAEFIDFPFSSPPLVLPQKFQFLGVLQQSVSVKGKMDKNKSETCKRHLQI